MIDILVSYPTIFSLKRNEIRRIIIKCTTRERKKQLDLKIAVLG